MEMDHDQEKQNWIILEYLFLPSILWDDCFKIIS